MTLSDEIRISRIRILFFVDNGQQHCWNFIDIFGNFLAIKHGFKFFKEKACIMSLLLIIFLPSFYFFPNPGISRSVILKSSSLKCLSNSCGQSSSDLTKLFKSISILQNSICQLFRSFFIIFFDTIFDFTDRSLEKTCNIIDAIASLLLFWL